MVEMLGFAPRLTASQTGVLTFTLQPRWYPRVELNHDLSLRRATVYPLNYEDMVPPVGIGPTASRFEAERSVH